MLKYRGEYASVYALRKLFLCHSVQFVSNLASVCERHKNVHNPDAATYEVPTERARAQRVAWHNSHNRSIFTQLISIALHVVVYTGAGSGTKRLKLASVAGREADSRIVLAFLCGSPMAPEH